MIRRLAGHTAAYTFAHLASRGTVLIWLILLPSFLSAADYGALGLILTTAALVNVVVPLEISQALARYYPPAQPREKGDLAVTAWTFMLVMLALAAGSTLIFARPACELLLGSVRYLHIFRISVGFFFLNTVFYFLQHQLRWEFRARDFTIVTLLFAVTTLAGSVGLAAVLSDSLLGVLLGQLIGACVGVGVGSIALRRSLGIGIASAALRKMLRFSLPLVPASVALFLSTYASRFILSDVLDLREVGVFVWASQLAAIPSLMLLGIQGALTPLVMKHQAEAETKFVLARTFEAVITIELVFCLGVGAFAPEVIGLLGYSAFSDAGPLVMLLAPAFLMLQIYVFFPGFAVAERTDLQLLVSVISAVGAIALNYLLIAPLGLTGAALATLAAGALFIGSWFALGQRLYPIPIHWVRLLAFIAVFVVAGAGIQWIGTGTAGAVTAKGVAVALLLGIAKRLNLLRASSWRNILQRGGGQREQNVSGC